jgi:hypothetical protein
VTTPDGIEQVEAFPDSASLAGRQAELERKFIADGWTGPHEWNI